MADEEGTGLPDELRPVEDDLDPATLAAVQRALGQVSFLRPDPRPEDLPDPEPMPDWVWARVSDALAQQRARQEGPHPSRRAGRWAGGLVAASVAVLAVGVAVTAFSGSTGGGEDAVVAGQLAAPAAEAASTDAGALAASTDAGVLAAPKALSFAGMVPPAFRLLDSDTDYSATRLREQVVDVLADNGMTPTVGTVAAALAPPVEMTAESGVPADGFTRSPEDLRDCVTKLTTSADMTALLVDRSTFEGRSAGVVVTPEETAAAPTELEVTVVDPECDLIMKVWISLQR